MHNKLVITAYLSIITLNVNELNATINRLKVAEWIRKQDPYICCLQETNFRLKNTHTKSKGMKKCISSKWKHTHKKLR